MKYQLTIVWKKIFFLIYDVEKIRVIYTAIKYRQFNRYNRYNRYTDCIKYSVPLAIVPFSSSKTVNIHLRYFLPERAIFIKVTTIEVKLKKKQEFSSRYHTNKNNQKNSDYWNWCIFTNSYFIFKVRAIWRR